MSYSLIKKLARQYLFEADAYSKKFGKRLDLTSFVEPFVNKKDENGINIYAVRMTDIPKLGINPKYGFDNPRGVYAYPLTQSIYKQLLDDDLPYVSDAKNILLIKIKNPKKWLNLSLKNFSEYRDWRDVCQLMLDAFKSSNFKSKKVYGRSVSIKNKSLDELFSIAEVDCEHWEGSNAANLS